MEEKESKSEKSLKPRSRSVSKRKASIKKKHHIRTIHISPTDNDAFVVQHDYQPDEDGNTPPSTTHALGDIDQLQDHIQDHLGEGGPAGGGEPGGGEPAPAPAAAPAPAGGPGGM
jgi:hypothetical protein